MDTRPAQVWTDLKLPTARPQDSNTAGRVDTAVAAFQQRLAASGVGRCSEGTLQCWLAICLAEAFGPSRIAAEIGLDSDEFDAAPRVWRESVAHDRELGRSGRKSRLHNAKNRLETFHDLVVMGSEAVPGHSVAVGDVRAVIELKATNSANLGAGIVRDDIRSVALTAGWMRATGRPDILPVTVVVATAPGRASTRAPDGERIARWMTEHVPPGVRVYLVEPTGVRVGTTMSEATE